MADFPEPSQIAGSDANNANESFRSGIGNQDINCNPDEAATFEQNFKDYTALDQEVVIPRQRTSQTTMDPMMRQAYAMPPAGLVKHQLNSFDRSPSRQYKMASDIFGTGMDKSWTASPGTSPSSPNNGPMNPITGAPSPNQNVPRSFKITEMPSNNTGGNEEQSSLSSAGRRARESSGNPLTGQGFNPEATKTGKRYFEGSNANQKLW